MVQQIVTQQTGSVLAAVEDSLRNLLMLSPLVFLPDGQRDVGRAIALLGLLPRRKDAELAVSILQQLRSPWSLDIDDVDQYLTAAIVQVGLMRRARLN